MGSIDRLPPNGGENLLAGTNDEIRWTTTGDIDFVKIEYSNNNGIDWIEIVRKKSLFILFIVST